MVDLVVASRNQALEGRLSPPTYSPIADPEQKVDLLPSPVSAGLFCPNLRAGKSPNRDRGTVRDEGCTQRRTQMPTSPVEQRLTQASATVFHAISPADKTAVAGFRAIVESHKSWRYQAGTPAYCRDPTIEQLLDAVATSRSGQYAEESRPGRKAPGETAVWFFTSGSGTGRAAFCWPGQVEAEKLAWGIRFGARASAGLMSRRSCGRLKHFLSFELRTNHDETD